MSADFPTLDHKLVESNTDALQEGAALIGLLKDGEYTKGFKPAFQSTIGAHFRHVLEHYQCFLLQLRSGLFCYDERARDQALECDSAYALNVIEELQCGLNELDSQDSGRLFTVKDENTTQPVQTSLNRELLFLQSHTVHHFAIIGAMTRAFGNKPDDEFGVAIATRVFNQGQCGNKPSSNEAYTTESKPKGAACAR